MYPILFEWGPIRIGSYGLLLTIAFSAAIFFTNREFRKSNVDVSLAWDIYLLAIFGGLLGSRLLYIFENWEGFLLTPRKFLFSATGFSVLGGYLLAIFLCAIRIRYAKQSFLKIADLCSPGLAVGYAVGRLGCLTAGDGCYGQPTNMFFGMSFPHGIMPTLSAKNPLLVKYFFARFPGMPLPIDIKVHPTPLYESVSQFILLAVLLRSSWQIGPGKRFALFLGWFGFSRFFVEFLRLNPISLWGLTSDQIFSIAVILIGCLVAFIPSSRNCTMPEKDIEPSDLPTNP